MKIIGTIKIERTLDRNMTSRERNLLQIQLKETAGNLTDFLLDELGLINCEITPTLVNLEFSEDENGRSKK